jgi:hypothetical protein
LILKSCVDARSKLSGNPLCRPVHSRAVFISAKRVAATLFRVAARSSVFRRFRIVGALAELVDNSFGPWPWCCRYGHDNPRCDRSAEKAKAIAQGGPITADAMPKRPPVTQGSPPIALFLLVVVPVPAAV